MVTIVKAKKGCCGKGTKFYCDICGNSWKNFDLATKCEVSCEEAIRELDA